jgi:hypothetical protein
VVEFDSVRNMRAGLHDILDAKNIISEWRQHAGVLDPAEGTEAGENASD